MLQVSKLACKNMSTVIITAFHIFESLTPNMLSRDMEDKEKRDTKQISRDENYNL